MQLAAGKNFIIHFSLLNIHDLSLGSVNNYFSFIVQNNFSSVFLIHNSSLLN
jgi:hypothetical protein